MYAPIIGCDAMEYVDLEAVIMRECCGMKQAVIAVSVRFCCDSFARTGNQQHNSAKCKQPWSHDDHLSVSIRLTSGVVIDDDNATPRRGPSCRSLSADESYIDTSTRHNVRYDLIGPCGLVITS
jgi:hypothetical protein